MKVIKRFVASLLVLPFLMTAVMPVAIASTMPWMPQPGTMVTLTTSFTPAHLWGMSIHPNDPFKFDFLVQRGDLKLTDVQKQDEYAKLIKYFLAALAVPDTDQWVNLSPYEKERVIPDSFGLTEMGRDLLAQDYLLKQLASSLTDPNSGLGKKFWDGVYEEAHKRFGTTSVPTDTFNKVWIMPDKAVVFEKNNTVYVLESHLKVMTEKDYLAMKNNVSSDAPSETQGVADISSQVMKEIVIPAIEKEVNEGKNFAPLRQVYSGMLLATWYKRALKESILGKLYADQGKVKGVDQDPKTNQVIYGQYVQAFQKGVFNMVKEDIDRYTKEVIPRKYFSGGTLGFGLAMKDFAQGTPEEQRTVAGKEMPTTDFVSSEVVNFSGDFAMNTVALRKGGEVPLETAQQVFRELMEIEQDRGSEKEKALMTLADFLDENELTPANVKKYWRSDAVLQALETLKGGVIVTADKKVPADVVLIIRSTYDFQSPADVFTRDPVKDGAGLEYRQSQLLTDTGDKAMGRSVVDNAGVNGGIDFAQSNLDMQIKRDGAGVPLPVSQQNFDNIRINGLVPVILDIRPASSVPTLMR